MSQALTRTAEAPAALAEQGSALPLRIARLFVWLALPLYTLFALITPPFQTPDEHQHLFRAWQIASGQFVGERQGEEVGGRIPPGLIEAAERELGEIAPHAANRLQSRRTVSDALASMTAVRAEAEPRFASFFAVIYNPVSYAPQVAAIWAGRGFGLAVEPILLLGRLFNLLLAIGLFYAAIRLAPVGRLVFLWVGLFPMTAACAASFGQDGLQIGGVALLTALGLRVHRNRTWRGADLALLSGAGMAVGLAKFLYLPMLLVAAVPAPREAGRLRWLAPMIVTGAAVAMFIAAWLWLGSGLSATREGVPSVSERLSAMASDPTGFARLLIGTLAERGPSILLSLFTFGWLSIGPVGAAILPSGAALVLVLLAGDRDAAILSVGRRLWLLLLTASVVAAIMTLLYLNFTIRGSDVIEGFQGRYLIPLMPAGLIALLRRERVAGPLTAIVACALLVLSNVIVLATIANVFYA